MGIKRVKRPEDAVHLHTQLLMSLTLFILCYQSDEMKVSRTLKGVKNQEIKSQLLKHQELLLDDSHVLSVNNKDQWSPSVGWGRGGGVALRPGTKLICSFLYQ
ncbi:hypothetical protein CRENBAI_011689 [Crenichthys baileyi]|uniref:Uncharacterized protein n=1 Tax=Crenichthys baileyi TaxID=28760 RepID=A0AAV9SBW0_9TELE